MHSISGDQHVDATGTDHHLAQMGPISQQNYAAAYYPGAAVTSFENRAAEFAGHQQYLPGTAPFFQAQQPAIQVPSTSAAYGVQPATAAAQWHATNQWNQSAEPPQLANNDPLTMFWQNQTQLYNYNANRYQFEYPPVPHHYTASHPEENGAAGGAVATTGATVPFPASTAGHNYSWISKNTHESENRPPPGKTRTKDKYRVVYSDHQRLELEKEFRFSRYITIRRKGELAMQLALSERQVKIWFQNRRAKDKRINKKKTDHKKQQQQQQQGASPAAVPASSSAYSRSQYVSNVSQSHTQLNTTPQRTPSGQAYMATGRGDHASDEGGEVAYTYFPTFSVTTQPGDHYKAAAAAAVAVSSAATIPGNAVP